MKFMLNRKLLSSLMVFAGMTTAANAQNVILEEIIVTAQKRSQNVRDVAATVNVVAGSQIDELSLLTFEDLERVTSGLQLIQPNPRNATIALRGVTVDPESGTGAGVDIYQNNVVQRADNIFGALYDIGQVELIRGPQGSVQGSTSPTGAILIHTKKPDLDAFGGYAQVTFSEANSGLNLQGALNMPLIKDKLGLRIAAFNDENDQNNITNLVTGKVQDSDITSYRASLLWQPTDNLSLSLVHQDNDKLQFGQPQIVGSRDFASAFAGVAGIPCNFVQPSSARISCRTLRQEDRAALAEDDANTQSDQEITTLNVDWNLGSHKISYIYGNTESTKVSRTENDNTFALPLQNFFFTAALGVINDTDYLTHQGTTTVVDSEVHELRFESVDNPVWNYMFGIYDREQNTDTAFESFSTAARFIPFNSILGPGVPGHIEGINFSTGGVIPVNSDTQAYFTDHSFQLSDATKLELSLRYQEIDRFNATPIRFGAFNQPERISIQGFASPFAGFILQGTLASIAATSIDGVPAEFQASSSDSTTGSIRLTHDFSDTFTSYLAYNTAYRPGGISINPGETISTSEQLYDEEDSSSIELGGKWVLAGGAAEINAAIYQQDFDGFLSFTRSLDYVNSSGQVEALTGGLVANADATFKGFEMDWRMRSGENWNWGGSLALSDSKFDNALIPCNIRQPGQQLGRCASNSRVPGSPEVSASLFGEYEFSSGGLDYFARGNAKYNDGILATRAVEFGADAGETPSYLLLDMFFGVRAESWELTVFAKNLLDEDADLDLSNPGDTFDVNDNFTQIRTLQERTWGIIGKVKF